MLALKLALHHFLFLAYLLWQVERGLQPGSTQSRELFWQQGDRGGSECWECWGARPPHGVGTACPLTPWCRGCQPGIPLQVAHRLGLQ